MFKVYPAAAAMLLALSAPGVASTFSIGPVGGESALMSDQTTPAIGGIRAATYGFLSTSFARPNIPFTGEVGLTEQAICGAYKSNVVNSELFVE